MLQRLAEDFEYSSILDKAALCQNPTEQIAYVAAFTVSSYAATAYRINKPFNPLLGETFELDRTDDLGWRLFAEQVLSRRWVSGNVSIDRFVSVGSPSSELCRPL